MLVLIKTRKSKDCIIKNYEVRLTGWMRIKQLVSVSKLAYHNDNKLIRGCFLDHVQNVPSFIKQELEFFFKTIKPKMFLF